jgi:RNA polymerase sigma-70 factor (ECF subfamily)
VGSNGQQHGGPTPEDLARLVTSLSIGDKETAGVLLDQHYRGRLHAYCWAILGSQHDAEDAVQEVLRRALTATRIPAPNRLEFDKWLFTIARHQCYNMLRKNRRRKDKRALPSDSQLNADLTGMLTRLVNREDHAEARRRFEQLSVEAREVLWLRYFESLHRRDIGRILRTPVSTVKTRLFEGLKKLRPDGQGR